MLIDEYLRQYNDFSPMEYYSLDASEKIKVDFDKDCLVCIWVKMEQDQSIKNVHYLRPQYLSDEYLLQEAKREIVKRTEKIEEIMRIDLIREKEIFDFVNPFPKLCEEYAQRFDMVSDNSDIQATRELLSEAEEFLKKHTDAIYAPLYYCMGTSYGNLRTHGYSVESGEAELSLEKKDVSLERELYCFRHCLELLDEPGLLKEEFEPYIRGLKLQLYTNYANALEDCGRKAAAMKFYRNVLEINPEFGMAEGNIGRALQHYSALVHDSGHTAYLHHFAYNYLKSSLNREDVHVSARKYFERCVNSYTDEIKETFLENKLEISEYSLGGEAEEAYRRWCLHYHLFLNPLNDLPHELSCFATDSLQLPDMMTPVEQMEPPRYFGMFNQLKQEYICRIPML